ncbi:MAG: protocatechuate 3,4-dioxygenase [Gemmatimonadota bacterium]|nr:protocatechuate 3,4-dioxygenase [Gemmatimonadota bacterium]
MSIDRRRFLCQAGVLGAAAFVTPGAFAEELSRTPRQTEGPYYPDRMPLDVDNDLLIINDAITRAVGEITHLTGRVTDVSGRPVENALVEIWQVDSNGVYIHTDAPRKDRRDRNFQGFGRFETGSTGEYRFRTIKPVRYSGARAAHIHFAINRNGRRTLTTQMYVKGNPDNERDSIFRRSGGASRDLLAVPFKPLPGSEIGELTANFDIVIGKTPEDGNQPRGWRW